MKILICTLAMCVPLAGCAVRVKECRPSAAVEIIKDCRINMDRPTECLGTLWLKVKCPTENL